MLKLYFSLLFFGILTSPIFSQSLSLKEYKNKYPDSDYVILENKSEISYYVVPNSNTIKAKLTFTESILILTNNSSAVNLIQVPYTEFEDVTITSAKYFKIDSLNKKVLLENVKTKYVESKNYYIENIFYSDLKVKQFSSTLPTGEGTLLTYSYEKTYHDLKFIDKVNIQPRNAAIESFELTIKSPKTNQVSYDIAPINLTYNDYSIQESSIGNDVLQKIKLNNISPQKTHSLAPPSNYYLPHFLIITHSYKINDRKYIVLEKTDDLYAWYNSLIKQLPPVSEDVKQLANSITGTSQTPEQTIESIFKWVQNNIQYIAFEDGIAGFKPENSLNVYKMRSGDCKGMANLLVDLLRAKGFNAYHTWIGTRHINYNYKTPSLYVDNHMICALEHNNQFYFLDATSKTTPWNLPPDHIQGKQALVGIQDNFKIMDIPVTDAANNKIILHADINLATPLRASVKGKLTFNGELVYNINSRELYSSEKSKKYIHNKLISEYIKTINHPSASIEKNDSKEYAISFLSNKPTNFGVNNQMLLLNADLDRSFYGTATDSSTLPVYMENTLTISTTLNYTLPTQAKITNIPPDVSFSSPDGTLRFSIKYKLNNNKISYEKHIIINSLLVKNINDWNDFISQLDKAYDHLLTIKLN
jgi:hypothetical protein